MVSLCSDTRVNNNCGAFQHASVGHVIVTRLLYTLQYAGLGLVHSWVGSVSPERHSS